MDWSLPLMRAALLLYCLAFVCAFIPILGGDRRALRLTPWLAAGGMLLHFAALVALGAHLQRCPLGTLPEVLSALGWAAALVYLIAYWRYRLDVLHAIILPVILVILFVAQLFPEPLVSVETPIGGHIVRLLHVTLIVAAVAALCVSFAASLAYVLVDRMLKAKRPSRFPLRASSLERCDAVARAALLWSFPILTLGILTGAVVNSSLDQPPWSWRPRETLAMAAWAILAVVVAARLGWGWRGRNAAILTIVAFFAVLLRMLGVY